MREYTHILCLTSEGSHCLVSRGRIRIQICAFVQYERESYGSAGSNKFPQAEICGVQFCTDNEINKRYCIMQYLLFIW